MSAYKSERDRAIEEGRTMSTYTEAADPKAAGDDGFEIKRIEIEFAIPVVMTPALQRHLCEMVNAMARATETDEIVHWQAGYGSKPIWNEPHEPTWDDSVYRIDTYARERYESEPRTRSGVETLIDKMLINDVQIVRGYTVTCVAGGFTLAGCSYTRQGVIEALSGGLPA